LQDQIGENQMKNLISEFRLSAIDLLKYENITKSFNEVYEVKHLELLNTGNHLRGSSKNNGMKIVNDKFQYDKFLELIPNRLKRAHLFNPVVKSNIEKVAYIYQFTNEDMYEVYTNSSAKGELPSDEKLRLQANLYYQNVYGAQKPEIIEKKESPDEQLEQIEITDIIKMYSKRDNIAIDLDTVVAFAQRNDADPDLLKYIVLRTIKLKEGFLPNYSYLEKVLNTFQNKGITTASEAIKYFNQLESDYDLNKPKSSKRTKKYETDWLDDYINSL
jgi:replication initiation and membrane attachment protein